MFKATFEEQHSHITVDCRPFEERNACTHCLLAEACPAPGVGTMRNLAVRTLLICAALSCVAQTSHEPETDVAAQVNTLRQKMALDALVRYQKDGDSALGSYYDKEPTVHVIEQFESLLRESSSLSHYLPDLKQYLVGYPRAQVANAQSSFYW